MLFPKIKKKRIKIKGHVTQKYTFGLFDVKSGVKNDFAIHFGQFDVFDEKNGIFYERLTSGENNSM